MLRRDLIAASAILPVAAGASRAVAEDAPAGGGTANISGVGLPIIVDGRVRNYVFVALRLHLGASTAIEAVRAKEAYLRDALVRAAHRTPFVVPNDWTQVDPAALSRSLVRAAGTLIGRGAVTRAEIVSQAPRRRTGMRSG